ncbi:MAG: Rieske 2Fe-2S domain-containing protein [Planctomycetes bacterium]|nr:Rieske 2Fe-2S domain-containing protein [Planctomycetota bacterium]MCB9871721.1 Rieske 2Fe-2S domain-containing protein [Planctomycetota bacterium]
MAVAPSSPPEGGTDRRGFLGFLTVVLGAVPVLGGLIGTMRAGLAPAHSNRPSKIPLCRKRDLPKPGSTEVKEFVASFEMRSGAKVESVSKVVFVTRDPKSDALIALDGECTHLSCPVQRRELKLDDGTPAPLTCPCHNGKFSRTGARLAGPPQRDLRRLDIDALPAGDGDTVHLLGV